ncbi:MAG: hypothetical protein KDC85_01235 [Saprospiraceae bacterium]|nr:hypothetical protein [Saprospiraceae bacterium]MCB9326827.1 hypothetical protein [Lewinellaceae bacterium]
MKSKSQKLGELGSTAICGNDISSSVLYVSALSRPDQGTFVKVVHPDQLYVHWVTEQ